jgi:hypothetical protein
LSIKNLLAKNPMRGDGIFLRASAGINESLVTL